MWSGPGQDPGGSTGPPNTQELNDLKDQFEQQQLLIAQLKEMLRKSEQTTVTQEKVEEYANTLTKMKARAKRSSKKEGSKDSSTKRLETPASEKINLLRQHLEENRAKLAERGKNQKGIEEMVTQLKAQLDDSQTLMNQTPLNLSLTETKQEIYSANSSSQELYNILLSKERRISEMTLRIQKLEANVLDLQENVKEKDSVIDARTKAITLMSENLSKKGKSTLDALDDTKLQMRKMQENFVELEMQMKEENQRLLNEVQQKEIEISGLKQRNVYLDQLNNDLQEQLNKHKEELEKQTSDFTAFENLSTSDFVDKSFDTNIGTLQERIKELEVLNKSLEYSKESQRTLERQEVSSVQEIAKLEQLLTDSNQECDVFKTKFVELENMIDEKQSKITQYLATINNLESTINELKENAASQMTESKLVNLDIKVENEEVAKLKKQLDESNKSMIKVKAQHKGKIKELNKKIDSFKKMGDANVEVVKLQDENAKLHQRVAELEENKGALQLQIMETDSTKEFVNDLEKKLLEQANLLIEKDNILGELTKRLEESNNEIAQLSEKLAKFSDLQNVQVKSEITSIQFEEQMDKLELEKQDLIRENDTILQENISLMEKLESLKKDKQEILVKLESYVQENIDLVDKLEKLSAEKVSSAESIEIVEGLTQQEKLELEAYQKNANMTSDIKTSTEHLEENPELNESVNQLTEETSELLQKIELFTVERREVMEKMEQLTQENNQLNLKLKQIENNRDVLVETYEQLQNEKEQLDTSLESLRTENNTLEEKLKELGSENEELKLINKDIHDVSDSNPDTQSMQNLLKEVEEYKSLIDIQKQEIKELKVHLMGLDFVQTDKLELEAKVSSLQLQYENILAENNNLSSKIKEQSETVHQNEEIQEELILAQKRITDFEEKITENLKEIENYKIIVEENKTELITSSSVINELQTNISALKNEVVHYNDEVTHLNAVISDLNDAITHLEKENTENFGNIENVNIMSLQLEELKQSLIKNMEQINEHQEELETNSKTIAELQNEIKTLNMKILETEHLLECKNDELKVLQEEKEVKDTLIQNLNDELKAKDRNFHQNINDFKERYLSLQKQLEVNTGSMDSMRQPLENKILELEHKNKEQLEKMKIIAANLKKKTQALQNLEQKYTEVNEKWETEQKEKETLKEIAQRNVVLENEIQVLNEKLNKSYEDTANQSGECQKLKEELFDYKQKFTSLENMNTKLSEEISCNSIKLEDAQNTLKEFEKRIFELFSENELMKANSHNNFNIQINEKEETIKNLTEQLENLQYASQTNSNALHMKIQELEMFIETQDSDLTKYKDRVSKLEEGLSFMEERRMSLERTAYELGTQLQEKTDECKEVSQTEDILEKRLSILIAHDEIIEKKLQDTISENEELSKNIKSITVENDELREKLNETKTIIATAEVENDTILTLENEITALKKTTAILENEKKNIKLEYEHKLVTSREDNEKMEIELQNQLELFDKDRRNLAERNEIMSDQIKEYVEQLETLTIEINDYKQKLDEQQKILQTNSEMYDMLQHEFDQTILVVNELKEINKNNENTILKLNQQILSTSKQEEIEQLRQELQQKSDELEEYQRQNLQLQMQKDQSQEHQFDFAASLHADNDLHNLRQVNENLHLQIKNLQSEKEDIARRLIETQHYLEEVKMQTIDAREESSNSEELKSFKAQYNNLEMNYGKLSEQNFLLQHQIAELTQQLQKSSGINVFTWPEEQHTITQKKISALEATSVENIHNTKEELLDKIKSLQFMLYETEKQRDDALMQCNTLSGELAKLLYFHDNQQKAISAKDTSDLQPGATHDINLDLESQILSPDSIQMTPADSALLREYEYSPTKNIAGPSKQPIEEEVIHPKSAYLCYPEETEPNKSVDTFGENDDGWGWGPEEAKLEEEHLVKASTSSQGAQFQSQIGVLEEKIRVLEQTGERHSEEIKQSQMKSSKLIKKLKEFKTKNEELASQLNKKSDGFDDLNDAIQDELKSQINNLEKRIKDINIELEKEKLEKSNLLKRVDTLTTAHERMIENKEKQDVEIMSWQRQYRELNSKLEQFEWGDDSPKHSQKMEPSDSNAGTDTKRIQELTDAIKDLTLDNEELQVLLEEQRNLRIAAEKTKSVEPIPENMKTEKEYLDLLREKDSLQKSLNLTSDQVLQVKEEYLKLSYERDALQSDLKLINMEKVHLEQEFSKLQETNEEFQQKINQLNIDNQRLLEKMQELDQSQLKQDILEQLDQLNNEKQQLIVDNMKSIETIEELKSKIDNKDSIVNAEKIKQEKIILELNKTIESLNSQVSALLLENETIQTGINNFENDKQSLLIQIKEMELGKNELNSVITDLNIKISNMENQLLSVQSLNSEISEMKELIMKKEEEISELRTKVLQDETEYESKLSTTAQQLTKEWMEKVDQRGYDIAESWKLHLEARENEFLQVEQQLKKEINDLEEKYTTLVNENNELRKNVDAEIRNEVDRISALQQQINDRQHYINDLSKLAQDQQAEIENRKTEINNLNISVAELNKQLDIRNDEIKNFKTLISEKDNIIEGFTEKVFIYETENTNLSKLAAEVENLQQSLSAKDSHIQDKDNEIKQHTQQIEELKKLHYNVSIERNDKETIIEDLSKKLQNSLSQEKINNDNFNTLHQQCNEYQQEIVNCRSQIQQQYLQIEVLNQELAKYSALYEEEVLQKQSDVNSLTALLQEKEREYSINLDTSIQENLTTIREQASEIDRLKRRLTDFENQYEESLSNKDLDIQSLRIQLDEQTKKNEQFLAEKEDFMHVQTELAIKTGECEEMRTKLEEQNLLIDEEGKQLGELREIIQDQVLKIDDLQKELYEKSRHYDALIAEVDLTYKPEKSQKPEKHVKFSEEVESKNTSVASNHDDLSEPVSRAELDLALYMLHQRDVRCEELTVELMQLLEERDTLQLKLSNALREKELLRSKYDISNEDNTDKNQSSTEMASTASAYSSDIDNQLKRSEEMLATPKRDALVSKLSELKTMGYHKDKTILDEQELRRLQQYSIMQQHRDEAAKLPPEAAARLVDASYTLSRDVQSPSKVLLNWLWGRSTPKVNNI